MSDPLQTRSLMYVTRDLVRLLEELLRERGKPLGRRAEFEQKLNEARQQLKESGELGEAIDQGGSGSSVRHAYTGTRKSS